MKNILFLFSFLPFILFSQEEIGFIDSCVLNNTNLKVSTLFETNINERKLDFENDLFSGAKVCSFKNGLILKFGDANVVLNTVGVELYQANEVDCFIEITTSKYGINRVVKKLSDGKWDVDYITKKVNHNISFGKLIVDIQNLKCNDTGTNPITIIYKKDILQIKGIDNLQFFEYDIDKNGFMELYILSYASCDAYLKVYRINE